MGLEVRTRPRGGAGPSSPWLMGPQDSLQILIQSLSASEISSLPLF